MRSLTESGEKPPKTTLCGRPDARAGEHRHGHLRDHRQVDADHVAGLDAALLEDVREPLDVAQELGVGHVALLALLAAPVVGHAVAAARLDVPVERVVGRVQLAAREPLVEGRLRLVEHGVPALEPVERLGLLGPPRLRVARGLLVAPTRPRSAPSRRTPAAARRAPGRGARRSPSLPVRTRSWCSLPYRGFLPDRASRHTDGVLEPAPEERAGKRHRRVGARLARRPGSPAARRDRACARGCPRRRAPPGHARGTAAAARIASAS